MRKILLSFLLGAAVSTQVMAQGGKLLSIGIKGVVSGSWVGELPTSARDIKTNRENMQVGYVGGVWFRIKVPIAGFYIQPEINFSQQNGKYTYQFTPGGVQPPAGGAITEYGKKLSLNSLEFPLSLGYRIPLGPIGFKISGGGVMNTILSAKQNFQNYTVTGGTSVLTSTTPQDITNQVKKLQLGFQGGIGFDFLNKLSVDVRLQQNLTNIYEGYATPTATNQIDPTQIDQQKQKIFSGQVIIGFRLY